MWWLAAAAAAPLVMDLLTPKPQVPSLQTAQSSQNPSESYFQNKMLSDSFNPNSDMYKRSADVANANVQNELARLGLNRSSAGIKAVQDTNTNLAANWQQQAAQRESQALGELNQNQQLNNQINEFNAGVGNEQLMGGYNAAAQNRANLINATGSLSKAGASIYGQQGGPPSAQQQPNPNIASGSTGADGLNNVAAYDYYQNQPSQYNYSYDPSLYNPNGGKS